MTTDLFYALVIKHTVLLNRRPPKSNKHRHTTTKTSLTKSEKGGGANHMVVKEKEW